MIRVLEIKQKCGRFIFLILLFLILLCLTSIMSIASNGSIKHDAISSLSKAENDVKILSESGLNIARINDILEETKISLNMNEYERTISLAKEISDLKQKVLYVYEKLNVTKAFIDKAEDIGINVASQKDILNSAKYEFELENFEDAIVYVDQAYSEVTKICKDEILSVLEKLEGIKESLIDEKIDIIKIEDTIAIAKAIHKELDLERLPLLYEEVDNLNKSANILIKAKKDVEEIKENRLPVSRLNDSFNEARLALELGDHKKVEILSKEIDTLKQKSIKVNNDITEVKTRIQGTKNLDVSEAEEILNLAISKFEIGDFENAALLLDKASKKIEEIISDSLLFGIVEKRELKFNIAKFTKDYWWLILIVLVGIIVVTKIIYSIISIKLLQRKINNLEKEMLVLKELMKKTQTDYFIRKNLSKESYEKLMDKHEEIMIAIKETIPVLKEKLKEKLKRTTKK